MLPVRPIIFLCGDFAQQQPIATIDGRIKQVPSIRDDVFLKDLCYQFNLFAQYRIEDNFLLEFLGHIRYFQPTYEQLQKIQAGSILCPDDISDTFIIETATTYPSALFLTVSNAASHYINETIIGANKSHPIISHVICTKEQLHVPIFKNMPVMLLENRHQATGYVNGQICKIHCMEGSTIIVKHKKGNQTYLTI